MIVVLLFRMSIDFTTGHPPSSLRVCFVGEWKTKCTPLRQLRLWFSYYSVIGFSCHFSYNNCRKSDYKGSVNEVYMYKMAFGCSMRRVFNELLVSREMIISICCLVPIFRYFTAVNPFRVMWSEWKSETFPSPFVPVTSPTWIALECLWESRTGTREGRCICSNKWVQICSVISGTGGRLALCRWGFCWRMHHLWRPS